MTFVGGQLEGALALPDEFEGGVAVAAAPAAVFEDVAGDTDFAGTELQLRAAFLCGRVAGGFFGVCGLALTGALVVEVADEGC